MLLEDLTQDVDDLLPNSLTPICLSFNHHRQVDLYKSAYIRLGVEYLREEVQGTFSGNRALVVDSHPNNLDYHLVK